MRDYGLSPYDAGVLVAERETADYFEEVAQGRERKAAANWVNNEFFGRLNKEGLDDHAGRRCRPRRTGAIVVD